MCLVNLSLTSLFYSLCCFWGFVLVGFLMTMRPSILAASAKGQDDSIMSLVIKRLCASLIYNQLERNLCIANIHKHNKIKYKIK